MVPLDIAFLLVGIVAGFLIAVALLRAKYRSVNAQLTSQAEEAQRLLNEERERRAMLEGENKRIAVLETELDVAHDAIAERDNERWRLVAELSSAKTQADELPHLKKILEAADQQIRRTEQDNVELRTAMKAQQESMESERRLLDEAKAKLSDAFEALSKKTLDKSNESFLILAEQHLARYQEAAKSDLDKRQTSIDDNLRPVKENLAKIERLNSEMESKRVSAFATLESQIKNLTDTQQFLHSETSLLVKALREPTTRGHYGQKVVRQVLEVSGMVEGIHFEEQVSYSVNGEPRRADVVVNLSHGQKLVIDAKAPLAGHMDFVSATDDGERQEKLKRLSQAILTYAKDLQRIEYWKQFEPSAGIVIMFVAPESALTAAMQYDASLWDECIRRRILLASPTTLVAMLLTVGLGWRQADFTRNAEEIRKTGQELYERLFTFSERFMDLGKSIDGAYNKYNKALGSLDGNLFPSARRMKELGVQTGNKEMPEIPALHSDEKSLRSKELLSVRQAQPEPLTLAQSTFSPAQGAKETLFDQG